MSGMFNVASAFNQNLSSWDVSKVTNFQSMFGSAIAFANGGSPDINNWTLNTSNPVNISYMFQSAFAFNQPLNNWNTSSVTDMSAMFNGNSIFNQPLNNWNTSAVKDMSFTFSNANSFNQPLNNWNTSSVTNMNNMFGYAASFNQNIGMWNVSNVLDFGGFMSGRSPYLSPANLDAIYNGWSSRPVQPGITITFSFNKRTSASDTGKAILTGSPNNWVITDGGI